MMEQASSPEVVAKVILQAVTSDNPQLIYTVDEDTSKLIEAKMSMPETNLER
jgi:hypothetical protein